MIIDDSSQYKNTGEMIRYRRKFKGISQQELATMVGVSRTTISRLENNQIKLGFDMMLAICSYLNIPVSYIFKSSSHKELLCNYVVGETVLSDSMDHIIGSVQINTDYEINKYEYICVTDGEKRYLAKRTSKFHDGTVVCICKENKICTLADSKEFDKNKYSIIGKVVTEITDIAVPIFVQA